MVRQYGHEIFWGSFCGRPPRSFWRAVFWGGLVAGTLDALDGVIAFHPRIEPHPGAAVYPSGLLGRSSFDGSFALSGCVLHFLVAFVATTVYIFASLWSTRSREDVVTFGLLYGVALYLFMNHFVLPLSAVGPSTFKLGLFLNGIAGHALLVGLPIAWFAKRAR